MKLISMKCPHCGGTLSIDPDGKQAKCPFCETPIMIDDKVRHIQFDNSKQAGFDFEVGRMQARGGCGCSDHCSAAKGGEEKEEPQVVDYRVDTVFPDPLDYHRCEIEKA